MNTSRKMRGKREHCIRKYQSISSPFHYAKLLLLRLSTYLNTGGFFLKPKERCGALLGPPSADSPDHGLLHQSCYGHRHIVLAAKLRRQPKRLFVTGQCRNWQEPRSFL